MTRFGTVESLYNPGDKMIVMTKARSRKLTGRFSAETLPTKCWGFKVADYHICKNGIKVIIASER